MTFGVRAGQQSIRPPENGDNAPLPPIHTKGRLWSRRRLERNVKRDIIWTAVIWVALSLAGEAAVLRWDILPMAAAKEAEVVDSAFRILTIMAVPVMAFVVAVLGYSVLRFRQREEPREDSTEDGPPIRSSKPVLIVWFLVTTALTVLMIIHPGITGLLELRDSFSPTSDAESGDLLVRVEGMRWIWKMTYPEEGVTTFNELVLPVDRPVRFEVSAVDVLHSFWGYYRRPHRQQPHRLPGRGVQRPRQSASIPEEHSLHPGVRGAFPGGGRPGMEQSSGPLPSYHRVRNPVFHHDWNPRLPRAFRPHRPVYRLGIGQRRQVLPRQLLGGGRNRQILALCRRGLGIYLSNPLPG